jgi:Ca-activated chloride channel homolog
VRILTPLGWLGLLAVGPLVLWYLLRPRRRAVVVPSTFLWQQVERPATASTPWQRFRGDATFWLVLLALLGLTAALLRPGLTVPAALGDHTILVVDASGSMLAREGDHTRSDLAREQVRSLLADLAPGQTVSLVLAGARAEVAVASTTEPRAIDAALATHAPTHGPGDLPGALALATALQRPGERSVVHVVTDRDVPETTLAGAPPGTGVRTVGSDLPNVAVTRLSATALGPDDNRLLVQVRSYALGAVQGRLVASVGGEVVVEEPLRLAPRGEQDVILTVPGRGGDLVEARVVLDAEEDGGVPDALPHDDAATIVLPEPVRSTVLVAGPGSAFVEAALATLEGVEVVTEPVVPADLAGIDLLVVDRTDAPTTLHVPTLLVGATGYPEGITSTGEVERPVLTFQHPDHPLLTDVDLTGLNVATARTFDAPDLTALATGPSGPLLLAGRSGEVPLVVLPFELGASDLPLRPAWPVLMANAVTWATASGSTPASVAVGSTVAIPGQGPRVVVHPPDDAPPRTVTVGATGTATVLVDRIGTWRVVPAGEADQDALLVPVVAASDVGDLVATRASTTASVVGGDDAPVTGLASLVGPIVASVLALVVLEWLWSNLLAARWRDRRSRRRAARVAARQPAAPPPGSVPVSGAPPPPGRDPLPPPVAASPVGGPPAGASP